MPAGGGEGDSIPWLRSEEELANFILGCFKIRNYGKILKCILFFLKNRLFKVKIYS